MKNNSVAVISTFRLILSLILVNGIGFTLKYLGYDTFIIVAGFRFHLSFTLPLLVLFPPGLVDRAISILSRPEYKRKIIPLLWILFAPALLMTFLYVSGMEIADPDYFYEFGLSSVFDFPVYLIWNFPQFLLLYLFLDFCTKNRKNKFVPALLLIFSLFLFELLPVDFVFNEAILFSAGNFIIAVICAAFLFSAYKNVYWFAITLFSAFWFSLLAFGSSTIVLINMLFAAQYNQWEGFFTINNSYKPYLLAAQLVLLFVLLVAFLPSRKPGKIPAASYGLNEVETDATV